MIARTQLGDVPDVGVVIGVGDPAASLEVNPDCGCDACDSGSANDLWVLDRDLLGVVTGVFRRLSRGSRTITVGHDHCSASGDFRRGELGAILLDADGWTELRGAAWLG